MYKRQTLNTSSINKSNNTDDSGIQTTPKSNRENKNNDNGVSFTDDEIESLLTPVQSKQEIGKDEKIMNMLQLILEQQSIKFEIQNHNFNELKNEIQELNKCVESTAGTIRTSLNKLEQSVERMGVHAMKTEKNKTNENCSDKCKNTIPDKELINMC